MIQNGCKNTYSLSRKAKKVTLAPRREGAASTPEGKKGHTLLSKVRFLEEAKNEGMVFSLVPCEDHGGMNGDMPPKVQ